MPQIQDRLREHFTDDEIVVRPDHPLLLRGPDVLVGSEGHIAALFIPQTLDQNNPAHLLSRLIATRLALPAESKAILLLTPEETSRFEALARDFALTTEANDRALSLFIRNERDFGSSGPMDPEIQRSAVKQFDTSFQATESAFRLARSLRKLGDRGSPERPRSRVDVRIENEGLVYQPHNRFRTPEGEASILHAKSRHNLRRQLVTTSSGHLLESFRMDGGIPVPKKLRTHVAIAEHADRVFGLRSYVITAAAFAGVAIAPADDPEVTQTIFSRVGSYWG